MKISELSAYRKEQEKSEKVGIKVWDRVHKIGLKTDHIIVPVVEKYYATVSVDLGIRWENVAVEIKNAMNRDLTKLELKKLLGNIDDWEVVT